MDLLLEMSTQIPNSEFRIPNSNQTNTLPERRLRVFEKSYGSEALDLACHAAFPLTLTSDLVYCLREQFQLPCPWYTAADLLLSGLCRSVGYDLYEMEGETRNVLLRRLCDRFGESRLYELEAFVAAYIQHRLQLEKTDRPRVLGNKAEWVALACLRKDNREAIEAIRAQLQCLGTEGNLQERLQMAALVESYADLLAQKDFRPILIDWADKVADGEPIDELDAIAQDAIAAGFPLELRSFEVATIVFEEEEEPPKPDELHEFEFETVTVNDRGEIVTRTQLSAFCFLEPLGDGIPPLEMVAIPGGKFLMGSPPDEPERYEDEGPQHEVTVAAFFLGKYPVTQVQWRFVVTLPQVARELNTDPSGFKGDTRPVERVSWQDAVEFCQRLARYTGRDYRLPGEAEWEYACRAGTTTPFYFGETLSTDLANYNGNYTYGEGKKGEYRQETTSVDEFPPNAWGLWDMHGNVWEWCGDDWHENYKVAPNNSTIWLFSEKIAKKIIRGGSWYDLPWDCRSAIRDRDDTGSSDNGLGFRVACPRAFFWQ